MRSEKRQGSSSEWFDMDRASLRESSNWLGYTVFQSASLIVCGLLQNASSAICGSSSNEPVPFFLCFEL